MDSSVKLHDGCLIGCGGIRVLLVREREVLCGGKAFPLYRFFFHI